MQKYNWLVLLYLRTGGFYSNYYYTDLYTVKLAAKYYYKLRYIQYSGCDSLLL